MRAVSTLMFIFLCLAAGTGCGEADGNADPFPTDGDIDSEAANEDDSDSDEDTITPFTPQSFDCTPRNCRDGFQGAPLCNLPEENRMLEGLIHLPCESDEDCDSGDRCTYTPSEWVCVPEGLTQWVAGYRWTKACAWQLQAEVHSTCAFLGGWMSGDKLVRLEQCPDEENGRICIGAECLSTMNFSGITLLDVAQCSNDGKTYVLLRDDSEWPMALITYEGTETGLTEIGRIAESINYWTDDAQLSRFVCNGDGELFWISPNRVKRLVEGNFDRLLAIEAVLGLTSAPGAYGAFDRMAFNPDKPEELKVGVVSSYSVWLVSWKLGVGMTDYRHLTTTNWNTRALPSGGDKWLIADGIYLYLAENDLEMEALFTKSANESLVAVDASGGLITRTASRLFRYPLEVNELPTAIDKGLPFPANYLDFIPAVRFFSVDSQKEKDTAFIILQYRPTGGGNGGGNMEPDWD